MSEALIALSVALALIAGILFIIAVLKAKALRRKKEREFHTVRSEGTAARVFFFTGKLVAKRTLTHPEMGIKTYKLYVQPSGKYRIIYPNGNVSFAKNADEVRTDDAKLAKKAGLVRTINLDRE